MQSVPEKDARCNVRIFIPANHYESRRGDVFVKREAWLISCVSFLNYISNDLSKPVTFCNPLFLQKTNRSFSFQLNVSSKPVTFDSNLLASQCYHTFCILSFLLKIQIPYSLQLNERVLAAKAYRSSCTLTQRRHKQLRQNSNSIFLVERRSSCH